MLLAKENTLEATNKKKEQIFFPLFQLLILNFLIFRNTISEQYININREKYEYI
jgi:hypothetical protein